MNYDKSEGLSNIYSEIYFNENTREKKKFTLSKTSE